MLIYKKKALINNSSLIIFAFFVIFYSRIIATTIHLSLLNLAHFIVVPTVCIIALVTTRITNLNSIKVCNLLLFDLFLLFGVEIASAYLNDAGLINAVVGFMMLGEPFIFLLAISCVPMSIKSLTRAKYFLYWSVAINFLLAAVQKPLIDAGRLNAGGLDGADGCGGTFFVSGAGNYISATISVVFAFYYSSIQKKHLWIKASLFLAALWQVLFSDSKQIVFAYGVAWFLLILINFQDIVKILKLLTIILVLLVISVWLVKNVEEFGAYSAWARPELYEPGGLAWYAKLHSIPMILSHYHSPLNWLFGIGPGHSVSRLGVWFLKDYASILGPLGSTSTSIGSDSMDFIENFWLTSGSSIFSPVFGWAGIWGDLGLLGLGVYLHLGYLVWKYFGFDDITKISILSVFVMGFLFTQMEEPGYMVSFAYFLGILYQEKGFAGRHY